MIKYISAALVTLILMPTLAWASADQTAQPPAVKASFPKGVAIQLPTLADKMKNIDNSELTLKEAMGEKGLLVIFSCNHCPYVKAWLDRMVAVSHQAMSQKIGVIVINSNDPQHNPEDSFEKMKELAQKAGMKFPYVVDATSNMARAFGAARTPEAFLYNPQGTLVYHGAIDDNSDASKVSKNYLADAIVALTSGKPVTEASTKFIGCSIKFRKRT